MQGDPAGACLTTADQLIDEPFVNGLGRHQLSGLGVFGSFVLSLVIGASSVIGNEPEPFAVAAKAREALCTSLMGKEIIHSVHRNVT